MVNAWSLLYDEMTESLGEDNYEFMLNTSAPPTIISGSEATDTISICESRSFSYDYLSANTDKIIFGEDTISLDFNMNKDPNRYKYGEDTILKELQDYISGTYNQHYSAGSDKIQTLDLIEACGDGEAFCRSNILKYASRYDKKGTARRDILKILHYAVLLMHFNDKNAQREDYPNR